MSPLAFARRLAFALVAAAALAPAAKAADAVDPAADLKAFQAYFHAAFPKVPPADFVNGPYSMNADMRKQWQDIEQFPPYDFAVENGKALFAKPFKDGKTFADCFPDKGVGIRQHYPQFDAKTGEVVTLEYAVNQCLAAHGEKPFNYLKDDMAAVTAYMAFTSRGKIFDIKVPDDPRAKEAYVRGERAFYARRGQLNFSCSTCHLQNAGKRIRAEVLAPALGIMAAMPIYRSTWGGMGTVTRRFATCFSQVRATPLKPGGRTYRDLEYFLTYMGNGLPVAGPGARP
ncbi:MAG: sulfur oxidation c-type cytochrome SoxA [Hyphomicrobiales bacterium]|nr:sulfur oxidation c-type cytochrome SoxA [Hyphomicrobiales bacterium]MDE2017866.1 sulfur oxidation c-type cytochrome SoxA [Hyphomicrobiales bacterium]